MNWIQHCLLLSAALLAQLTLGEQAAPGAGQMVELTDATFKNHISTHSATLVMFYAPWCGHCKKLKPDFEVAADQLKDDEGISLAIVDATKETQLAKEYSVQAYPTVKLFRKNKPEEYTGGRTVDAIVTWMRQMTGTAVNIMTKYEIDKLTSTITGNTIVGHFTSEKDEAFTIFSNVAEGHRIVGSFLAHFSNDATNTVKFLRPNEDSVEHKVVTEELLEKWVEDERLPLFGAIDGETYGIYMHKEQEMVWFCGSAEDFAKHGAVIRGAAKELREENSFVWLDTVKFMSHAEQNLGLKKFPGLVLEGKSGRFHYPGSFDTSKSVVEFMQNVKDGKIARHIRSLPIPEKLKEGNVEIAVGLNFEDVVFTKDTDALVFVFAPWCGHCKKFHPSFEAFADMVSENPTNSHVKLVSFDGSANDLPTNFSLLGFPTIYYVKAGSTEPIVFDAQRSIAALKTFVEKHASKPVSIDISEETESSEKDEL